MNKKERNILMQGCFSTNDLYSQYKIHPEKASKAPTPNLLSEKARIPSKSPISSLFYPLNQNSYCQIHQAKKHIITTKNFAKNPRHPSLSPHKEKTLSSKNTEITEDSDKEFTQSQPKTPNSPFCPSETKQSLLKAKLESLTQADTEINQLSEKIIFKENILYNKRNSIQTKIKDIKNTTFDVMKKNVKILCEDIVWNIVNESIVFSMTKFERLCESRLKGLEIAINKVKNIEEYALGVKGIFDRQFDLNLQKKMDLAEIVKKNLLKTQELQKMMMRIEDVENDVYMEECLLKKREDDVEDKIKKADALEIKLKSREILIEEREREKGTANINHYKITKNEKGFTAKESVIKAKELELNQRVLMLEQKKGYNEELKSKIKWRACNLENLAKKSDKIIQEIESRLEEYELYKKTEEKILETWKEKLEKKEEKVGKMEEKAENLEKICGDIEKRVKEKERKLECMKEELGIEKIVEKKRENEAKLKEMDYSGMKFTDFTKGFQVRQMERRRMYEELSLEKKKLTDKITSILNFP